MSAFKKYTVFRYVYKWTDTLFYQKICGPLTVIPEMNEI